MPTKNPATKADPKQSRATSTRPGNGASTTTLRTRSPLVLGVAATVVVALLALVAVVATSSSDKTSTKVSGATEFAAVRVTGTALSPQPSSGDDPSVGASAPRLDGFTFSGGAASIVPGSGPIVVMFVAHWCPHCQREVPLVAKWAEGGTANGVSVRAVSTSVSSGRPNYPPSAWLTRENFTVPTMVDDENTSAATAYGLTSFPYFVAMDSSGKVVSRVSGEITEAEFNDLTAKAKSASS